MSDPVASSQHDDDVKRIQDLEARIKALTPQDEFEKVQGHHKPQGAKIVMHIGTELMAGVVVGLGMGYTIDKWLDTTPWFIIICFLFGCAGSGLTIYRLIQKDSIEDAPTK